MSVLEEFNGTMTEYEYQKQQVRKRKAKREYVIVSMKHANFPFLGCLVYWGRKRTADIEERTFGGYTFNLDKAEKYTLKEIMDERKDLHLYEGGGMKEMEKHENVIIKVDDLLSIDSFITATVVYRP